MFLSVKLLIVTVYCPQQETREKKTQAVHILLQLNSDSNMFLIHYITNVLCTNAMCWIY